MTRPDGHQRRIGIRVQLSIVFAISMVLVAAVLITVHYTQARSYLTEIALAKMELAREAVVAKTYGYFKPATQLAKTLSELNVGSLSAAERESLFFKQAEIVLDHNPQIFNVFMALDDGYYARTGGLTSSVRKLAGIPGGVETRRARGIFGPNPDSTDRLNSWSYLDAQGEWKRGQPTPTDYDARSRPWYPVAIQADEYRWFDAFQFTSGKVGILGTRSLRNRDGRAVGLVGVTLTLDEISVFLSSVSVSENSVIFVAREGGPAFLLVEDTRLLPLSLPYLDVSV